MPDCQCSYSDARFRKMSSIQDSQVAITFRIFLESLKSGTVCMPVPSTSQTSAKAMDHKPASPDAISDPPRKSVGVTAEHYFLTNKNNHA